MFALVIKDRERGKGKGGREEIDWENRSIGEGGIKRSEEPLVRAG
jgi:hypothetical protein